MRRGSLILTVLFFIFALSTANAQSIKITNVTGASNQTINSDGTAKIFGGIAGEIAACGGTQTSSSTCNSCTERDKACNTQRVHDSLILRIEFTVTEDLNAPLWFGYKNDGSTSKLLSGNIGTGYLTNVSGNLAKDTSGYVEIRWATICNLGTGQTCDAHSVADPPLADTNFELILGAGTGAEPNSKNAIITAISHPTETTPGAYDLLPCADPDIDNGVCKFEAKPGDEKIFIRDVDTVGEYPDSNGLNLIALRIFYSDTDFVSANYNSSNYVDLEIPNDNVGEPKPDTVTRLQNGQLYYFRPAVVDEAYNVAFLVDSAAIAGFTDTGFTTCGVPSDDFCGLMATPDKVFGLLTEDLNCFVSTAAFGSTMASEVQTFRKFRNEFLSTTAAGKKFIAAYYNYGPKLARVIHSHPILKPMARVVLYPALWFSKLSLLLASPFKATVVIFLFFGFCISIGTLGVRRWSFVKR